MFMVLFCGEGTNIGLEWKKNEIIIWNIVNVKGMDEDWIHLS